MALKMQHGRFDEGFTLVELSVVLAIFSILAAATLPILFDRFETNRQQVTLDRLEAVENALLVFRKANNRLPCPGDLTNTLASANFGVTAANSGTCTGGTPAANFSSGNLVGGTVPVKTLGLPDEYATDGWNRRFAYHVDARATGSNAMDTYGVDNTTIGSATVNDASGTARTAKGVYVVVSFGPNGHGGHLRSGNRQDANSTNTDEQENCDCDADAAAGTYNSTFVMKAPTEASPTNSFDDIVAYRLRSWLDTDYITVGDRFPTGAVVAYNSTVCPDGWSTFSAAQDLFIVGAGGSFSLGDTSASASYSVTNTVANGADDTVVDATSNVTPPHYALTYCSKN